MQDSVSYPKPQLVTEERVREALAKQEKQRALREALDRQIKDSEARKGERAGGVTQVTPREKPKPTLPIPHAPDGEAAPTSTTTTSEHPPSQYTHTRSPAEHREAPSDSKPTTAAAAVASAPPVPPVEPSRYTFDFENGHALFTRENTNERVVASATNTPRSPRRGSGAAAARDAKAKVGRKTANKNSKDVAKTDARPASNPRRAGKSRSPTGEAERRATPLRSAAGAAGKGPRTSSQQPKVKTGAAATHESTSLPANIEEVLREKGMLPSKPPTGAAAKKRGGAVPGVRATASPAPHETQSLPVDLVRDLTAAAKRNQAQKQPPSRVVPPLRPHEHASLFTTPNKGNAEAPATDDLLSHRSATDTFALPAYQDKTETGYRPSSSSSPRGQPSSTPNRPRLGEGLLYDGITKPGSASGALLSPGGGRGRKAKGVPLSSRPPGGVLPPLERPTSQGSAAGVIEMSALLTPTRAPLPTPPASQRGAGKATPASSSSEVARLQNQLRTRSAEMKKMQEKEKNWEDQVKRLREELMQAKRNDLEMKRAAGRRNSGGAVRPPRAETAPEQSSKDDVNNKNTNSKARPQAPPSSTKSKGAAMGAPAGKSSQTPASAIPTSRKTDFTKAKIFSPNTFRPITAPEFSESTAAGGAGPSSEHNAAFDLHGAQQQHQQQQRKQHAQKGRAAAPPVARQSLLSDGDLASPDDMSFKMASLGTRQVTLGLAEQSVVEPVAITLRHLLEFAEAAFITKSQAEQLWTFFGGSQQPRADAAPPGQQRDRVSREYATQDRLTPMEPSIMVEEIFTQEHRRSDTNAATKAPPAHTAVTKPEANDEDDDDEEEEDSDDEEEESEEDEDEDEDSDEEDSDENEEDEEEASDDATEEVTPRAVVAKHRAPVAPIATSPLRRISDLGSDHRHGSPTSPGSAGVLAPSLRRKISRHSTDEPLTHGE